MPRYRPVGNPGRAVAGRARPRREGPARGWKAGAAGGRRCRHGRGDRLDDVEQAAQRPWRRRNPWPPPTPVRPRAPAPRRRRRAAACPRHPLGHAGDRLGTSTAPVVGRQPSSVRPGSCPSAAGRGPGRRAPAGSAPSAGARRRRGRPAALGAAPRPAGRRRSRRAAWNDRLGGDVEPRASPRTAAAYARAASLLCSAWNRRPAGSGSTGTPRRSTARGSSGPAKSRRCSGPAVRLKMNAGRRRTTRMSGWRASKASSTRST